MTIYTSVSGNYDSVRKDILDIQGPNIYTDLRLQSKAVKVLGHLYVNNFQSIWCDGNIILKTIEPYTELLKTYDIVVFKHPDRECLYDEAEICKKWKLDYFNKIQQQVKYYEDLGFPKKFGLYQCGIIARNHTPELNALCEKWWAHITRFSWRDQISFPFVFKDFKIGVLPPQKSHDNSYYKLIPHKIVKRYGI